MISPKTIYFSLLAPLEKCWCHLRAQSAREDQEKLLYILDEESDGAAYQTSRRRY